jgi:hypothetical protein
MASLPSSFSVAVDTKRRACVLDAHLALSPFGLLLAQRLSSEFDLWLVRELWQILDNTQYYLLEPERLVPVAPGKSPSKVHPSSNGNLRETLAQWDTARTETDLGGLKIYWIGDAISESLLPSRVDPHLVSRFEILASSLDARARKLPPESENVFADCFRDAVALTAALSQHRAFILTLQAPDNTSAPDRSEPFICGYLRHYWRVRCNRVEITRQVRMERDVVLPLLTRAGATELMWAGLKLAAVHVLAPRSVVIPRLNDRTDSFAVDVTAGEEDTRLQVDWWNGALSFWYSLSPDDDERTR